MSDELRLAHPAGAALVCAPHADGHWRVRIEDAAGVAFALSAPPYFQHAETTGAALLLVGEYAGTHYSLAATVAGEFLHLDFAERWNDRVAGKLLEVHIDHWRNGAPISMGLSCNPPWTFADGCFRCQHPAEARRAEYRIEFRAK